MNWTMQTKLSEIAQNHPKIEIKTAAIVLQPEFLRLAK